MPEIFVDYFISALNIANNFTPAISKRHYDHYKIVPGFF